MVINQSRAPPKHPGDQILPSLEVPIPHYRLGTPRFSTRGTAFLHSQVYSRASTNDNDDASAISGPELDALFPVPPGMEAHATLSRRHSQNAPQPHTVHITPAAARIPITTVSTAYHRAKEPIVPAIFDAIAANPDDPAIVRYAMSTREISAASPARLIAQITSKNFLDYELLSDFFLTVRAYMSTHDLLAYLLTRFEWAVNRFDDDGRVIRVRAFAAIRHWVLNYFPYDFVMDRDLRVKFCQYLNNLTRQVRQRSSHEPSDLKLIIDLKKCWNGRCALYWDNPMGDADGRHELDISPGGIVGSRDSHLTHPSELWAKIAESSSQQVDQAKSVAALHNWVDSVIEAEVEGKANNDRGVSLGTSRSFPMASPLSEQSIPAMSCTIPGKTMKAYATTQAQRKVGPHPVPTVIPPTVRKICPAAASSQANEKASRVKHDHKRSGSFSDALRDKRTSLPSMQGEQVAQQVVMTFPFSGSLIRGSVFPPGSPFIDGVSRHDSASNLQKQGQYVSLDGNRVAVRPMSPGVKNLLGTIRRAIGSKQSSNSPTPTMLSGAPFMVETKDSGLPMHIAYKIEGFGDQHHQLEALKKNARIDLLCADVTEMFERAMSPERPRTTVPNSCVSVASEYEREQPSSDPHRLLSTPEREALQRTHSEMTYGSQSIVIVDDTASAPPPVPSLPAEFSKPAREEDSIGSPNLPYKAGIDATSPISATFHPHVSSESQNRADPNDDLTPQSVLLPSPFTSPLASKALQQPTTSSVIARDTVEGPNRSQPQYQTRPSMATGKSYVSYRSSRSGRTSLRKYASYQSGMRRSGPDNNNVSTSASGVTQTPSKGELDQPPGRMLRRKPGGDLRANQSVHDLEPIRRPKSTGSMTTYTDSIHNSANFLKRVSAENSPNDLPFTEPNAPPATVAQPVSLMSSRQSQPDLRPSFELAVAEFARIPDDEGGDLEATLLKLEGKFRKSPVVSSDTRPIPLAEGPNVVTNPPNHDLPPSSSSRIQGQVQKPTSENTRLKPSVSNGNGLNENFGKNGANINPRDTTARSLYTDSEESYNATPLLERSAGKPKSDGRNEPNNATASQPTFSPTDPNPDYLVGDEAELSSLATGDEGDYEAHLRRGRYRSSMPTCTTDSFLLDEDEFLSDLSSELSDSDLTNEALDEAFENSARFQGGLLPANVSYANGYLPSPPMTTENAIAIASETNRIQEQRKPPTPEPSPVSRITDSGRSRTPKQVDGAVLQPFANTVHQFPTRRHIPFTLAFDAAILAQQFAIIERDALNEINWQDLIDMRFQSSKAETLNWVEYLRFGDASGIELVTARFNIIVKWAQSEIVLTHSVEERAMTVIKYINVAQSSRTYHNYATMLQLTIALTSLDIQRLTKTWELVPAAEKATLKELEALVSPLRNFHNLRLEMETADLEDGCIPVIGKS